MIIPKSELFIDPSSYVDPGGVVFLKNDEVLRALRVEFDDFYTGLLREPLVMGMLGRELVETEVTDYTIEGFRSVLRHKRIDPLSYCVEWPPEMLRDAGILTIEIAQKLLEKDLTLQDAYPWNVYFDGPKPVFVDYTSISQVDEDLLWRAYGQFCSFFLYPLVLYSFKKGEIARKLLLEYITGISDDTLIKLLPWYASLKLPALISNLYVPRIANHVVRKTGKEAALNERVKNMKINPEARKAFFGSLKNLLLRIPLRVHKSQWRDYYTDIDAFFNENRFDTKQKTVAQILSRLQPKSVIDIGCNQGGYSILAARAGAKVTSFDTDESCVSLLYRHAKEQNLNILPLVMDIINPTPGFGLKAEQFRPANKRFRGEMAFALALIHHLAFTYRQDFDRIVGTMADYTSKWLLTEFVPIDDDKSVKILATNRRVLDWYNIDNFLAVLKMHFSKIEMFDSNTEGRKLILCSK